MPKSNTAPLVEVYEDSSVVLLGQLLDEYGVPLVQADFSSLTLNVYDTSTGSAVGASPYTLTASSVIKEALVIDRSWERDERGYNFRYNTLPAQLPGSGIEYHFELKSVLTSGQEFHDVWPIKTLALYAS